MDNRSVVAMFKKDIATLLKRLHHILPRSHQ